MSITDRPLWTCPRCGAKFVTRNQSHSCGRATLGDWTRKMSPRSRELFAAFEAMIGSFGPYYLAPAKTRIAFLGRVRFAGVTAVTPDSITVTFALPRHLRSKRFVRVDEVVPGWFVHRLVITDRDQLDPEVRRWFRQSYEELGMQGRLKSARR